MRRPARRGWRRGARHLPDTAPLGELGCAELSTRPQPHSTLCARARHFAGERPQGIACDIGAVEYAPEPAQALLLALAAAGLAQNLGALRALATVGIQAGHMKLHLRNMIASAGASADEIEPVVAIVRGSGERITMATVESALQQVRGE